jgi:diguanylate cyclase (GGDEF)-like protein/PAS domain S-box-containing protein
METFIGSSPGIQMSSLFVAILPRTATLCRTTPGISRSAGFGQVASRARRRIPYDGCVRALVRQTQDTDASSAPTQGNMAIQPLDPTSSFVPVGAGDLPDAAFRMIVDMTANAFVVIELDGTVRYAGGSIEHVLGWRPDQVAGHNMVEFLPPDQVGPAIEAIAEIDQVDRAGMGVPMVFELLRPDGTTTWVEIGAMPLLDVPGVDGIAMRLRAWDGQHDFDEFLNALLADRPLDDVLVALTHSIAGSLEADGVLVHYGFDGHAFARADGFGVSVDGIPVDAGPWCTTATTGERLHVPVHDLEPAIAAVAADAGLGSCWTVPIPRGPEVAPAVLSVWRVMDGPPLIGHRHVLDRSARYVQLALVRTAEHLRLRHLAGHDALTGVANRAEFRGRLAHALAIGERDFAVAFCDLDGFKPINDTYGHRVGDSVLVAVADRLRLSLRTGDELARIGGDEFTVLLRNVPDANAARHVADRLLAAVREPFDASGHDVVLGISVGVALARPGVSADGLLVAADEALYAVKRSGGGTAHVAD